MCVVSMIHDHYADRWGTWPKLEPPRIPTQEEIDEFRRLLERAREYDKRNNEPECELESKRQLIKDLAKKLGIEVEFV